MLDNVRKFSMPCYMKLDQHFSLDECFDFRQTFTLTFDNVREMLNDV